MNADARAAMTKLAEGDEEMTLEAMLEALGDSDLHDRLKYVTSSLEDAEGCETALDCVENLREMRLQAQGIIKEIDKLKWVKK